MRLLYIAILTTLIVTPTYADLYDAQGLLIPGDGPKGRYTRDQLRPYALKVMPGEIIEESSHWNADDFYHEYSIKMEDGSIYELEYVAINGDLFEIEVGALSDNPILPPGLMKKEIADDIALKYVREETRGRLPSSIKESELGKWNRNLAYIYKIRKGVNYFHVVIDAFEGIILEADEL